MGSFQYRHISEGFVENLLNESKLNALIRIVKQDPSLDLEMRGNKIIIYYNGGKILTCYDNTQHSKPKSFVVGIDPDYIKDTEEGRAKYSKKGFSLPDIPLAPAILYDDTRSLKDKEDALIEYFAKAKIALDSYEACIKRHLGEKEIQQRIVMENNYSVNANNTDYFIADVEWADNTLGGRADIIGFEWIRNDKGERTKSLRLTFVEVKQGKNAIESKISSDGKIHPGLIKHYKDFKEFSSNSESVSKLKDDMAAILCQKYRLGLINGNIDCLFKKNTDEQYTFRGKFESGIDFLVVLANYVPDSGLLNRELTSEFQSSKLDDGCKFALSTFCGYGIYRHNVIPYNRFVQFSNQICKNLEEAH